MIFINQIIRLIRFCFRAATNDYFRCRLICWLFSQLIDLVSWHTMTCKKKRKKVENKETTRKKCLADFKDTGLKVLSLASCSSCGCRGSKGSWEPSRISLCYIKLKPCHCLTSVFHVCCFIPPYFRVPRVRALAKSSYEQLQEHTARGPAKSAPAKTTKAFVCPVVRKRIRHRIQTYGQCGRH